MPEVPTPPIPATDKKEFPCQKCGAKLQFKPGTDAIVCDYCGHSQKVEVAPEKKGSIVEHDFLKAISEAPSQSIQELNKNGKEVQCNGCGANTVISEQSGHCPFCGSPIVVDAKSSSNEKVIVPESILPFNIDKNKAKNLFMEWIDSLWFAPNDLKKRAQTTGMDGVYLPYWTYDTNTTTNYRGERGEYYYTTETFTNSKGETETRQVRHTRWYPASGTVHVDFDDVLVCASRSLPQDLIDELEPWDLENLKPYDSAYLSGFITERYKTHLKEGFEIAKDKMEPEIESAINHDIGGDEQRINSKNVDYQKITFKHILLPLWISSFRYTEKVYRFMINARTGEVQGERPYSKIKIALAVIGGAILAYGGYYIYQMYLQ